MKNIIFRVSETGIGYYYVDTDSKETIALQIMDEQENGDGYRYIPLWDLMDIISWSCEKAGYKAQFEIDR